MIVIPTQEIKVTYMNTVLPDFRTLGTPSSLLVCMLTGRVRSGLVVAHYGRALNWRKTKQDNGLKSTPKLCQISFIYLILMSQNFIGHAWVEVTVLETTHD